jgi:hypothetical protein
MAHMRTHNLVLILATAGFVLGSIATYTQGPGPGTAPATPTARGGGPGAPAGAAAPAGGGGRGRGGLPGATPEQTQAVADMNTALAALNTAVTTARTELATVTFADVKNVAGIATAVEQLRVAEFALATKRAEEFAKLQAGPHKLNPEQVTALIAAGGNPAGGGRGGAGAAPAGAGGRGTVAPAGAAPPAAGRGN